MVGQHWVLLRCRPLDEQNPLGNGYTTAAWPGIGNSGGGYMLTQAEIQTIFVLEAAARIAKLNAEADELFALHDQGLATQQDKTKISICLLIESFLKTEILRRTSGDRWSLVGNGYLLEIKPTGLIPGELRVDVSRIVDEGAA